VRRHPIGFQPDAHGERALAEEVARCTPLIALSFGCTTRVR